MRTLVRPFVLLCRPSVTCTKAKFILDTQFLFSVGHQNARDQKLVNGYIGFINENFILGHQKIL